MNRYLHPEFEQSFSADLLRECGTMPLCTVRAVIDAYHPVTIRLGGAVMVLTKRDALNIAHNLVNAVLSLPKGI